MKEAQQRGEQHTAQLGMLHGRETLYLLREHPHPTVVTAISTTFRHTCPAECGETWLELAAETARAAAELTTRIGGPATP